MRNEPNVAPTTRKRVLEAIQALSLPAGRAAALRIALIVPDHDNPFFTNLAFQLDQECDRRGASLTIASSDGRADREMHLVERFTENEVDGLLFISSGAGEGMSLLAVDDADRPPVVSLDRLAPGFDAVTVDPRRGTVQAIDHLVTRGHVDIGYIKGLYGTRTASDRFDAFIEAMALHRLDVREEWVFEGDFKVGAGKDAARQLLNLEPDERPTALLAANDLMAMGVMQAFGEAELPLPEHMSIVGFDGIPAAEWITPKLSTIVQPAADLAREALNLLIANINSGSRSPQTPHFVFLESEFKVGDKNYSIADRHEQRLRVLNGGARATRT
jgi:DNA-binding LacI/PurR family transcriptional regulator